MEISLEELADVLGEALSLPRIEPKGKANLVDLKHRYNDIRRIGPESLRHFKRTYVQALKRQVSANEYNPRSPRVVPVREDARYRGWTNQTEPIASAAIIYIMDVSGSMTDEQKGIVRTEAFWIDTWIKRHYRGVERRYIIHDAAAREVDEHTFYHTRESGGTRISAAYEVAAKLIATELSPEDWNLYVFHFSDGDNWGEDNARSVATLKNQILPLVNLFGYGQVESPYGSGEFLATLKQAMDPLPKNLVLSTITGREEIVASIQQFLGQGS